MMKKKSPVEISKVEKEYLTTLKERDRRHFIACRAAGPAGGSIRAVCKAFGCSPNTVSKGIHELLNHIVPPGGRQRMPGGGAKKKTDKHPEWVAAFRDIVSRHMVGLPQDESVVWLDIGVPQIRRELRERGHGVSDYIVRQMIRDEGLKRRSFTKSLPLREVEDRDAQFVKIDGTKAACMEAGIPIISVDTKKKELIGNFKRDGQVYCESSPKALDHDFETFSEGTIVPHGIYDLAHNTGYLTIGTSHDTSEFVCENIERVWDNHMKRLYPDAEMLVVLCDGGGSNSCRHHIVKQDLMDLADRIGMKILIMHYPPYCSKFNPIEHRLFSQITRSWSGTPLFSIADACRRAANTVTKKGLKVFAEIVDKVYETQRKVHESFRERLARQVVFDDSLHNWNYVISPSVSYHVII
jgi:hypothetical protein